MSVSDPEEIGDRHQIVKENYPHTFDTPIECPDVVDFSLFWTLKRPLDLTNPFDRDTLWGWIAESIARSCVWLDVLARRGPCGRPAEYRLLRAEAETQLAYKVRVLRELEALG